MNKSTQAVMLATAVAMLFGGAVLSVNAAPADEAAHEAKVQCGGVTGCKGQSDCKTATNACKGQNSCMGQGFKELTKSDCEKKSGKILNK